MSGPPVTRRRGWPAGGRLLVTLALLLAAASGAAGAQPGGAGRAEGAGRPGRERLEALVQRRLALSDAQVAQLRQTAARFSGRRTAMLQQERAARHALRAQVQRGASADQREVERTLDTLFAVQRRRLDLIVEEQRALAAFLTPVQRAGYLGLQERAFRAAQQMRDRRAGRGPRGAGPGPS